MWIGLRCHEQPSWSTEWVACVRLDKCFLVSAARYHSGLEDHGGEVRVGSGGGP